MTVKRRPSFILRPQDQPRIGQVVHVKFRGLSVDKWHSFCRSTLTDGSPTLGTRHLDPDIWNRTSGSETNGSRTFWNRDFWIQVLTKDIWNRDIWIQKIALRTPCDHGGPHPFLKFSFVRLRKIPLGSEAAQQFLLTSQKETSKIAL